MLIVLWMRLFGGRRRERVLRRGPDGLSVADRGILARKKSRAE